MTDSRSHLSLHDLESGFTVQVKIFMLILTTEPLTSL
jgi:hypothetical protein